MNLNQIKTTQNKLQNLSAEELAWKLFEQTGEIIYYNLCKSLENLNEQNIELIKEDEREF